LEFKLFQPGPEVRKDFYSELPINIQVIGKYEELGLFVSGLASLPRIVTVHDVSMAPLSKDNGNRMTMSAIIKTYNESGPEMNNQSTKKKREK
jgi:type IV pilus assembly protein PilO